MNLIPTARGGHLFAAVLALTLTSGALAQTAAPTVQRDLPEAKQLLKDAVKAMGGREAIESLESSKMVAAMSVGPNRGMATMTTFWSKPDRFMMKQSIQGFVVTIGFDGKIGWASNPMTGGYELLEDEQIEQVRGQANMHRNITEMEKDFQKIETIDLIDFDGRKCYKVLMVPKMDDAPEDAPILEQFSFFNAETKLMDGMQMADPMSPNTVTIKFKDWKKTDEVMFYRLMIIEQTGQPPVEMKFTEIELNKVDPSVFEAPDAVKKLAKEREEAMEQDKEDAPDAPGAGG